MPFCWSAVDRFCFHKQNSFFYLRTHSTLRQNTADSTVKQSFPQHWHHILCGLDVLDSTANQDWAISVWVVFFFSTTPSTFSSRLQNYLRHAPGGKPVFSGSVPGGGCSLGCSNCNLILFCCCYFPLLYNTTYPLIPLAALCLCCGCVTVSG